jgi:DNA-directed RNA polymerase II subunit RPB1
MRGISANVMTGQNGYYGTSAFQVVLDMDKLVEGAVALPGEGESPYAARSALDNMIADFERMDVYGSCAREKIGIKNNIKNIVPVDLGKGCTSGAAAGASSRGKEDDIGF